MSRDDFIRKNKALLAMHARSHQRSADSISPKMVHDEVPPTSGQKSFQFDINLFFQGPLLERPSFCQIWGPIRELQPQILEPKPRNGFGSDVLALQWFNLLLNTGA